MNYTCKNCIYRNSWDCEDNWWDNCPLFKLDEDTLSEEEKNLIKALRYVLKEYNK